MLRPSYSSDIAPSDYHLFRGLQDYLTGKNSLNGKEGERTVAEYFVLRPEFLFRDGIRNISINYRNITDNEEKRIID